MCGNKKRLWQVFYFVALSALLLILCACAATENPPDTAVEIEPVEVQTITMESDFSTVDEEEKLESPNMVDERFELVSLVFRLAGRREYEDKYTEYQRELSSTFGELQNHPAVTFAAELPLGYDAVFKFAVHIVKLSVHIRPLIWNGFGRISILRICDVSMRRHPPATTIARL